MEVREVSGVSSCKGSNPIMRITPSCTYLNLISLKGLSHNPIILGVKASPHDFWGSHIQFLTILIEAPKIWEINDFLHFSAWLINCLRFLSLINCWKLFTLLAYILICYCICRMGNHSFDRIKHAKTILYKKTTQLSDNTRLSSNQNSSYITFAFFFLVYENL